MSKKIKIFVTNEQQVLEVLVNEFLENVVYHDIQYTTPTFGTIGHFTALLVYTDRRTYGNDTLVIPD